MLTSSTFRTRSGNIYITIDDGGTARTFEVDKIGKLLYSFFEDSGEESSTSVASNYGAFKFGAWDGLDNGDSFFSRFSGLASNVVYPATMVLTDFGGTSYTFPFQFRRDSMKYDRLKRRVDISLFPPELPDNEDIATFVGAGDQDYSDGGIFRAVQAGKLIQSYLGNFVGTSTLIRSSPNLGGSYPGSVFNVNETLVNASEYFVIINKDSGANQSSDERVRDHFLRMSLYESSIFGSAFGVRFWVWRRDGTSPITLTEDDLDSIIDNQKPYDLQRATVQVLVGNDSVAPQSNTLLGNDLGARIGNYAKNIENALRVGTWNSSLTRYDESIDTTQPQRLLFNGASAYRQMLGGNPTALKDISIEVNDIYKIKPYDCFTLSGLGSEFSGTYRPNELEYDFQKNIVNIKAYQI